MPSTSTLVTYTALHPVTIPECKIHTDECLLHSNFPIKYEAAVSIKNKEGYVGNLKKSINRHIREEESNPTQNT